jgi:hypothetical protein
MPAKKTTAKKRTTPRKTPPAKVVSKKAAIKRPVSKVEESPEVEVPHASAPPAPEPKPFTKVRRPAVTNPMILTDVSGKRIAIAVRPDGSFSVGREGQSAPRPEPQVSNAIVLKGLSGRKIVIAVKPDGSTVVGREGAPSPRPKTVPEMPAPEKLEKTAPTTPESVGVVLEGTIGEERNEENPFGDRIKPEDVNPNVKHLDPRLLQPMTMRIDEEVKTDETSSPDKSEVPAKRRPKEP